MPLGSLFHPSHLHARVQYVLTRCGYLFTVSEGEVIIIIINQLTARVVGALEMIL